MHRAEKSSSKICRTREVEKAQELHRKKIDGVKSYLCGKIPKPAASRSSTSFRLRPARSMTGSFSSMACVEGEPPLSAGTSLANSGLLKDVEQQITSKSGERNTDILILDDDIQYSSSSKQNQQLDEFQRSLAKMDEFREVVPIPGLGSVAPSNQSSNKLAPPPAGSRKISMNASFRARRLKEIKADNEDVVDRIRKSVSHYRNDDLQRDWQQNLSYLSSISEFPVSVDLLASPKLGHKHHNAGDDSRSCFGPSTRRSSFLKPSSRAEPLPSIPVVAHPIKSIPTSPKKLQLNMSPAFRSLRKAMPQHPSLPPISSPRNVLNADGACDFSTGVSNKLLPSPSGRNSCPNSPGDENFTENRLGRGLPHRSSTAIPATKFIGDLHGKQAENEVSSDAKYQLLKTGRFVGGTYLVLTVFCGDGVTNPYGFDVFAYHRELKCEYKLSVTKEMTHELLDKSSSSSLAAETAAAAGTNLSMQEIARNICDHINFALLGTDQGEMIFLTPSVERKSEQAMRFDASPNLVAFCLHQTIELGETESDEIQSNQSSRLIGSKRRRHVFASTCPPTSYPANRNPTTGTMATTGLMIRLQITESLPPSRYTSPSSESTLPPPSTLKVEMSVDELYNTLFDSCQDHNQILSVDRVVIAALRHLHIIAVPSGDNSLRNELIVNAHVNTLLQPCPSRLAGTTSLEKKRPRQQLPHSTSQLLTQSIRSTILFQSGLVWRNTYLLAEVALDNAENVSDSWYQQRSQRQSIRDVDCGLLISVFNSNSGRSSCRRLLPDNITVFLERLEVLSSESTSISDQHTFAKELLTRLQLDVDLFGQEVIVFPALEHASNDNVVKRSEKVDVEVDSPEEHTREFPQRGTSWEEKNISDGDESADSEAYDEDRMEEATGLEYGILPYDTEEEEEREEADASYSSYANQDEAEADLDVMAESFEDAKPQDGQGETLDRGDEFLALHVDVPDNEKEGSERSTRRSWRQGRKLDGRFCLLQGSTDDSGLAVRIAALGQLEILPSSSVYRAI